MCRRGDSIRAVNAAAAQLELAALQQLEAHDLVAPDRPLASELRKAIPSMQITPTDMLKTLGKLK